VISTNLGPISLRFRDTATYSLKPSIAAKPLQMETWLLLTVNKKSPATYPTVLSPTHYNLPLIHDTARLTYHSVLWPSSSSKVNDLHSFESQYATSY